MATTDREQETLKPEECQLGSTVWDIEREVPGVVMGHEGGRVQLRALNGGREWDAKEMRRLTHREEFRLHLAARNAASRNRP